MLFASLGALNASVLHSLIPILRQPVVDRSRCFAPSDLSHSREFENLYHRSPPLELVNVQQEPSGIIRCLVSIAIEGSRPGSPG